MYRVFLSGSPGIILIFCCFVVVVFFFVVVFFCCLFLFVFFTTRHFIPILALFLVLMILVGERGGSVVECRTPEREVRGSRPTAAVLCP